MNNMDWFPKHKCGLYLTHNAHKDSYYTVAQWIEFYDIDDDDWVSVEEKAKAIETDSMWELQWYPDNPVGFYRVFASSLDALKEYCKKHLIDAS